MISRVSNIPISERAASEAADILWADGQSHEIEADKPYIYMARYIGFGDINEIECFRCENLNKADEEEWNRCINQECITVLLYFVFSEKSERELFKEYGDAGNANDMFAREEAERAMAEAEEAKMESDREADLSRIMDRVVEQYWDPENGGHGGDYTWVDFLMEYKNGNEDILWEDHLVYFDGAENDRADVYGVISPEFGTKGIIIDYREKAGDDSNTNYFDWNWDIEGFCPQIEMADFDGDGRDFLQALRRKRPGFPV